MKEKLLQLIYDLLSGKRAKVVFIEENIVASTNWDKPQTQDNISDVTFTNMSTAGTIYVKSVPLEPGQSRAYACDWNEVNTTNYQIRIPSTVIDPLVIVDYKTFNRK